ncbi:uncharacterized protein J4E88_006211 [Alternaria novae-zelandiae]|uniref:uncharacterized protein n=1 Tax=Alternaria novae-zelandiae TaxID=430562 RepID=UPI0020C4DD80|nr:uncharacterized protein J4E88_006211 [Alternaria novae-zelandiae]KAI4678923.1 hypothetical protein J4E88_006211 [Alternaria novae-zelandiae]
MPPKKKVDGDGADTGGDGAFRWTPENELTLLLLTMGRAPTKDDYIKLVDALPPGTNWNAIRQRFSKLRKDQQKRFEELGWDMPDGVAAAKTPKTTTPKKRAAGGAEKGEELGGDEGETETPTKKPRARNGKKEVVKKEVEADDMLGDDAAVKEELLGEDV